MTKSSISAALSPLGFTNWVVLFNARMSRLEPVQKVRTGTVVVWALLSGFFEDWLLRSHSLTVGRGLITPHTRYDMMFAAATPEPLHRDLLMSGQA